jgi:hypothetical protein
MGSLLFNGNCTTCHFERKDLSAPAMIRVKEHYLKAFPEKKEFVKYLSQWVVDPNEESSIMQGAIKKYGIMPHLGYEKEVVEEIAAYIYDTNFKKK